jgi:hypothetical protein
MAQITISKLAMLNNAGIKAEKLTVRRILSVRCPVCRAKPKEKCTLSTGHPCVKTHHGRSVAAAEAGGRETFGQAALRILKATSSCRPWRKRNNAAPASFKWPGTNAAKLR